MEKHTSWGSRRASRRQQSEFRDYWLSSLMPRSKKARRCCGAAVCRQLQLRGWGVAQLWGAEGLGFNPHHRVSWLTEVVHLEVEAGRWGIQGRLWLHSEFEASLGYMKLCLKNKTTTTNVETVEQGCRGCRVWLRRVDFSHWRRLPCLSAYGSYAVALFV